MKPVPVQVYRCENPACTLGSREDHGRFSGGMTKEQFLLLTGNPEGVEGENYGEGVCVNCAVLGVPDGTETSAAGSDPYDDLHQEIAARVADPADSLSADDAQDALMVLVDEREAAAKGAYDNA